LSLDAAIAHGLADLAALANLILAARLCTWRPTDDHRRRRFVANIYFYDIETPLKRASSGALPFERCPSGRLAQ
jgi:hypothetical protein